MKDLEFRAWDKKDKKMLSSSDLFKCGFYICPANGTINAYGSDDGNDGWGENDDLIPLQLVMQFREFKNGINIFNKIFEGDIIKSPYPTIPNLVVIYLEGAGIYALNDEYIDCGQCVKYLYEILNEGFKLDVIGNVFENPELLK